MKTKWILLSIFSMGIAGLFAQGSIEGNLKNEDGKPLSFANIIIYQGDEIVVGTSSDFEGFYFVDNLKEGVYEIVFSYMGNKSEPQTVTVKDRETFVYNTEIISGTTIGPIYVGPPKNYVKLIDKFEPTAKITTKKVFTETGIKVLADALDLGGSTTQDQEGNTSFRGSRPGQAAFYVDGMRIAGNLDIPTASINRMKVYSGGVPARYGNTTSAVIVIETNSVFDYFD